MELNVGERLSVLSLLPKEGNFITLKIVRKLQEELSFSEEELELYKIVQKDSKATWSVEEDEKKMKDVKFGGEGIAIVVKALKDLDKNEKLLPQQISLYEKFIEKEYR